MKPYILALFACSVVAVGQSKVASIYPPPCKAPDKAEHMQFLISGEDVLRCVHFAKPHKAKTPAKCAPGNIVYDQRTSTVAQCVNGQLVKQLTQSGGVKPSDLSATMEALAPTKWSCTTDATENRVVIVCEKGSK